ncbi:uncharacterized protein LOC129735831 [Falco cherrug]|uniref:uncharacterized protein LOC129735831 n=1 Tax=Falco cherrug TaxID=345164 RepID=UPI0024794A9C|nr:uncharacterized protein LOC129735831 [Falco cherrug]
MGTLWPHLGGDGEAREPLGRECHVPALALTHGQAPRGPCPPPQPITKPQQLRGPLHSSRGAPVAAPGNTRLHHGQSWERGLCPCTGLREGPGRRWAGGKAPGGAMVSPPPAPCVAPTSSSLQQKGSGSQGAAPSLLQDGNGGINRSFHQLWPPPCRASHWGGGKVEEGTWGQLRSGSNPGCWWQASQTHRLGRGAWGYAGVPSANTPGERGPRSTRRGEGRRGAAQRRAAGEEQDPPRTLQGTRRPCQPRGHAAQPRHRTTCPRTHKPMAQQDKRAQCPAWPAWQEQFIGSPGTNSLGMCERGSSDAKAARLAWRPRWWAAGTSEPRSLQLCQDAMRHCRARPVW